MILATAYRRLAAGLNSNLLTQSFIYIFSSVLNALTNLLLLPVLTKYLTPGDYGIIETFLSIVALLTGIIVLGSNTMLSKQYFDFNPDERAGYIGNSIIVMLLMATVLTIGFYGFSLLHVTGSHLFVAWAALFLPAVLVAGARAVFTLAQTIMQLGKNARTYALFVNGNTFAELALSLVLIVLVGMQWQGRLTAIAVTQSASMLLALYWLKRRHLLGFNSPGYARKIIAAAPPLVIAHIAGWGVTLADRLIITGMVDAESTGLYGVGARFASVMIMIGSSISLAWLPFFYGHIRKRTLESDRVIVRMTYVVALALLTMTLAYGTGARWVLPFLVDPKFNRSADFIFLLSLAYCADGIWKLFTGYLISEGKLGWYAGILCAAAALNVLLDYVFIHHWGIIGAAWGTLFSLSFGMVATIMVSIRIRPMPWLDIFKPSTTRP